MGSGIWGEAPGVTRGVGNRNQCRRVHSIQGTVAMIPASCLIFRQLISPVVAPAVARPIAVRTPSGTTLGPFTARLRAPAVAPCQLTSAHGQRVT